MRRALSAAKVYKWKREIADLADITNIRKAYNFSKHRRST